MPARACRPRNFPTVNHPWLWRERRHHRSIPRCGVCLEAGAEGQARNKSQRRAAARVTSRALPITRVSCGLVSRRPRPGGARSRGALRRREDEAEASRKMSSPPRVLDEIDPGRVFACRWRSGARGPSSIERSGSERKSAGVGELGWGKRCSGEYGAFKLLGARPALRMPPPPPPRRTPARCGSLRLTSGDLQRAVIRGRKNTKNLRHRRPAVKKTPSKPGGSGQQRSSRTPSRPSRPMCRPRTPLRRKQKERQQRP